MIRKFLNRAKSVVNLFRRPRMLWLANIAEGTHAGTITKLADAAITTRFLLVKPGTDGNHIALSGANDCPLGVCEDEPSAAEEPVAVALLGCSPRTVKMVANGEITALAEVYTAASGKISAVSAVAGTYYRVGRAIQASTGDGDTIEVDPYPPTALVVS